MGQNSVTLHEPAEELGPELIDRHRAIASLMEELEAVDWYDQRVASCTDDELRKVLAHNRDEEKEHASMVLEWLRRNDATWDKNLKRYLFTEGPITEIESEAMAGGSASGGGGGQSGSLNIGSLRKSLESDK